VALIIQDVHGVFVDVPFLEAVLGFAKTLPLTHLILNGDGVDFPMISKFTPHVSGNPRLAELQYEVDCTRDLILKPIRQALPNVDIVYILGNHEERLQKYLNGNAKPLASLRCLNFPELMGLPLLNIAYKDRFEVGGAFDGFIYHGKRYGKTASKLEVEHHKCNLICGHIHRDGFYQTTGYHRNVACWHFGHFADKDAVDLTCGFSEYQYWSQSAGILKNSKDAFSVERIYRQKGGFYYHDRFFPVKKNRSGRVP